MMFDESLEELYANKTELEYNIKQAIMLYPEDRSLMDWKSSYEKSFFLKQEMIVEQHVDIREKTGGIVDVREVEEREKNEETMVLVEEDKEEANVCEEKDKAEKKVCEEADKGDEMGKGKKVIWPDNT